ncbi:hypothetical protein SBRCBS47491_003425 [Sporothrix bragantina]|uniref:Zn(2)-C6 fungal-type domain-containing protein n=1 Tax=Sporothrix bragantina TaxID=671064 RepID=A0ABP0BG28_9PEZI
MDAAQSPSAAHKHACASCARRKIRCDRQQPCSNCEAQARMSAKRSKRNDGSFADHELDTGCVYVEPPPVQRHRRKLARATSSTLADDLVDRLRAYEELLSKNGIALPQALAQKKRDIKQYSLPRPPSRGDNNDSDDRVLVDDRIWIASPWEAKMTMHKGPASTSTVRTPSSGTDTLAVSDNAIDGSDPLPVVVYEDAADAELDLWQSMPPELRNPPVSSVFARRFFGQTAGLERAADDGALSLDDETSLPIAYCIFGTTSPVTIEHPEPRMILRLWQIFIDNVNPIMRIVHVPTTHQQIVDASWDAANAPPATGALMFAIYTLALTSMTAAEYADLFAKTRMGSAKQSAQTPPPKRQLLTQYRRGAMQCLVKAGLLTTRRIDVLRAFTLLILAEPDSELSSTLASMAVHLGLKMGLHRETHRSFNGLNPSVAGGTSSTSTSGNTPGLSFFEREMSVRLWWQIRGIDARMRQAVSLSYTNSLSNIGHSNGNFFGSGTLPPPDLDDLRLPLNVNDADLHPAMTCAPVEHTGLTEMLYVRVKYHTALWMRAFAQKKFASGQNSATNSVTTPAGHHYRTQTLPAMKNRAIDELEQLYYDICHRHADPSIPLHNVSSNMARMAVAQLRFQAYHPRTSAAQPPSSVSTGSGSVYSGPAFSRHNADATFQHALSILEMCFMCRQVTSMGNSFAAFQLLADVVMRVVVDATVYVVCMLRVRTGGGNEKEEASIDSAWRMIELFYKEYGEDLSAAVSDYEHYFLNIPNEQGKKGHVGSSDETAEESKKLAAGATFVTAFTDLTLEAWKAREQALHLLGSGPVSTPQFIAQLQAKKAAHNTSSTDVQLTTVSGWGDLLFQEDPSMDWEYWNNFLRM